MELVKYHKLRTAVQENASPGVGSHLTGLQARLHAILQGSAMFTEIEVGHTDNPDRLVIALCQFRHDLTEWEVAMRLEQLWDRGVRYPFWEAHTLIVEDAHVELEGASRQGPHGHYVTVHLVAQRARLPEQRTGSD